MNYRKASQNRRVFLVVVLVLLTIISLFAVMTKSKFESEEPGRIQEHYSQLVNERCGFNFPIIDIIFGDNCFWGFQDVEYELICKLNPDEEIDEAYLIQHGWCCSDFPEEFVEENIIGSTKFTNEMYAVNLQHRSYWIYVDKEVEQYGRRLLDGVGIYRSSHYLIALYVPDEDILYYLEESI